MLLLSYFYFTFGRELYSRDQYTDLHFIPIEPPIAKRISNRTRPRRNAIASPI